MQEVRDVAPGHLAGELLFLSGATLQGGDVNPDARPITGGDRHLEECRLSTMDAVEIIKGSVALDKPSEEQGVLLGRRSLEGEHSRDAGDLGADL